MFENSLIFKSIRYDLCQIDLTSFTQYNVEPDIIEKYIYLL